MSERIYTINELKAIIGSILKDYSIKKAILFGSYAKENPTVKSDIDLVITGIFILGFISYIMYYLIEKVELKYNFKR